MTFKFASVFTCVALLAAQALPASSLPNSGTLTKETMPELLRSAGYDPHPSADSWTISAPLFGQSQTLSTGLSPDGTLVWVFARVANFSSLDGIPAASFSRLLLVNDSYAPGFFSIQKCDTCSPDARYRVWFQYPMENRNVTAVSFRAALDKLVNDLTKTVDSWDQKNWRR